MLHSEGRHTSRPGLHGGARVLGLNPQQASTQPEQTMRATTYKAATQKSQTPYVAR